jgi:hypothetical protein
MKKRSLFSSLVVALVVSAAPAGADTWEVHGNRCQPDTGDVGKFDLSNTGLFNVNSSSSGKLHCPIEYISDLHTGGLNSTTLMVRYVDRSSASDVTCTLYINLFDGSPILTQTKTSPAGASDTTQAFEWSIGSEIGGGRQLEIQCTIPKATSSSTRSGVRGIRLDTNT